MSDCTNEMDVKSNYQEVLRRVEKSATISGRNLSDITVVGVTKRIEMARIQPVLDSGLTHIGEIVGTEFKRKIGAIRNHKPSTVIHVIGHLQSNKVKFAVEKCDLVESVESEQILSLLNKYSERNNKLYPIFFQVDFSDVEHLKGLTEKELLKFLDIVKKYTSIEVRGLMTIAPLEYEKSSDRLRKFFSKTYSIYQKKFLPSIEKDDCFLSMGMSSDYEIAIEEGSNLIRVGTAIFGPRNPK